MNVSKIRRARGDSFARKSAYCGGLDLAHPTSGKLYRYGGRTDVVRTELVGWRWTLQSLAKAACEAERRRDGVEGRMVIVALPRELDEEQQFEALRAIGNYFVREYGVAALVTLHSGRRKGRRPNPHGHILPTSRRVIGGNRLGPKARELDDLKTGPECISALRAWWAGHLNSVLAELGFAPDVEHRSFLRLGIDRTPSHHIRSRQAAIERSSRMPNQATERRLRPLPVPAIAPVQPGASLGARTGIGAAPAPKPVPIPAIALAPAERPERSLPPLPRLKPISVPRTPAAAPTPPDRLGVAARTTQTPPLPAFTVERPQSLRDLLAWAAKHEPTRDPASPIPEPGRSASRGHDAPSRPALRPLPTPQPVGPEPGGPAR